MLGIVKRYLQLGWRLIPCPTGEKHPRLRWKVYQEQAPTEEELEQWFAGPTNISLLTGAVSRVIVLDIDQGGVVEETMPETPCVETGSGGRHYYFRHPGFTVRNWAGKLPHVDCRGDGGLAVLPPSLHPSGRRYRWLVPPWEIEAPPPPPWLLAMITPPPPRQVVNLVLPLAPGEATAYGRAALRRILTELSGAQVHTRNSSLNSAAYQVGRLVAGGELAQADAEPQLIRAGLGLDLPEREVRQTVQSGLCSGLKNPRSAPHNR